MRTVKWKVVTVLACLVVGLWVMPAAMADDDEDVYVYANDDGEVDLMVVDQEDESDAKYKLTGQVRARYEYLWNYFGDNTDDSSANFDVIPYRAQLGVMAKFTDNVSGYLDVQAFGNFGDSIPERSVQGPYLQSGDTDFLDSGQVNLYQAFVKMDEIGGSNFDLRVGRAEHIIGNELQMGNNSFYNGLSFDGVRGWYNSDSDRWNVQAFVYWVTERNVGAPGDLIGWGGYPFAFITGDFFGTGGPSLTDFGNVDARHGGVDFTWSFDEDNQNQLTVYALQTASRDENSFSALGLGNFVLDTVGALWKRNVRENHGLDWSVEYAAQFGTADRDTATELDFGGSILEGWVGWKFGPAGRVRVGTLIASGDDNDDDTIDSWIPLFTDAHQNNRLGNLDLFGGNLFTGPNSALIGLGGSLVMSNVTNFNIRYEYERGKSYAMIALHDFKFTEDVDVNGMMENAIGQEIDLEYRYQYSKNLAWDVAYSYLTPGDTLDAVLAPMSADPISRFWLQANLTW